MQFAKREKEWKRERKRGSGINNSIIPSSTFTDSLGFPPKIQRLSRRLSRFARRESCFKASSSFILESQRRVTAADVPLARFIQFAYLQVRRRRLMAREKRRKADARVNIREEMLPRFSGLEPLIRVSWRRGGRMRGRLTWRSLPRRCGQRVFRHQAIVDLLDAANCGAKLALEIEGRVTGIGLREQICKKDLKGIKGIQDSGDCCNRDLDGRRRSRLLSRPWSSTTRVFSREKRPLFVSLHFSFE